LPGLEGANPIEVGVDADHRKPNSGELDCQREAHIPLTDDGEVGAAILDALGKM